MLNTSRPYFKPLIWQKIILFFSILGLLAATDAWAQYRTNPRMSVEQLHSKAVQSMQAGNYAIAYCIWQPLADGGDTLAQYNIGWMFHNGYGLSIDDETALFWWLKAALSGHADAHFALGDLYANGQGVEKNMHIAIGWYISAAMMDHEPARETLMNLLISDNNIALQTFEILLTSEWSLFGEPMQISVDRANTRNGPGTQYEVVTTLDLGHPVIPLREENGWTLVGITSLGKTAWVFNKLISRPAGIYAVD